MIPQKIIEVEVIDETCTIIKKKYNDEKVIPNIDFLDYEISLHEL